MESTAPSYVWQVESGGSQAVFQAENEWRDKDGRVVCTDSRLFTVWRQGSINIIEIEIELVASQGPLVIGDTKEGTMAFRVAPTLRLKGPVAQGHIAMSTGKRDKKAWGTRAKWCHYYGSLQDGSAGVALFDHPQNLRHPTWWHARDYGLCSANPFGISYFDKKPRGAGDYMLESGKKLKFQYLVLIHDGELETAELDKLFNQWIEP